MQWGCAHCLLMSGAGSVLSQTTDDWTAPPRHQRPEVSTDEGGLWAMMDREEVKLRRSSFVIRDATWREYIKGLTDRMAGEHAADMRVYTVRTPMFNASMAPNGMMQIWTGLLLRVENEAQLLSVVGHEIGHYLQRHSISRLRDAQAKSAFATLLVPFGVVGLVGQLGALASLLAFSREHEVEADRIGLQLLLRAGHDPREASKVWANLRQELAAGAGGDPAKNSVLFATHPGVEERQTKLDELSTGKQGFLGQDEYLAKIEPFLWDLSEDELKRAQFDESIVLFDRLCRNRAQRGDLRYFLGEARRMRAQADDVNQSMADFQLALTLQKPPAQAHRSLGFIHRQRGQKGEAVLSFQRYVDAIPQAPDVGIVQSYIAELKG
jgi:beta-barrel assembly-enhancing protease